MEEFKNLKEIIELCSEELIFKDESVNATLDGEDLRELRNLINKCKEQEKHIKALDSVIVEHIEKNKEQEKMIELMAKDIANNDFDEDICRTMKVDEIWCGSTDNECKNCVIEYYKKKASGK